MVRNRDRLATLYTEDIVPKAIRERQLAKLIELINDPGKFLRAVSIDYIAPSDAANTHLDEESVDCHFSVTVLEHIPEDTLVSILYEATRILKRGGFALHFIDLSDHFQHQDPYQSTF